MFKIKNLILFLALFWAANPAFAAELRLVNSIPTVRAGDNFSVELYLHSPTESVNGFEGTIIFGSNLKLKDIRFSGSVVPLWITKPAEKEKGRVEFAGILPGGYQGAVNPEVQKGDIFTLLFEAVAEGDTKIYFDTDAKVYLNDGEGGLSDLSKKELSFAILPPAQSKNKILINEDVSPPESFTPIITSGQPFEHDGLVLVFNTQDKDSGISHYKIGYSNLPKRDGGNIFWQEAESPFFLPTQNKKLFVYVGAVDKSGNERVEVVSLASYAQLFTYTLLPFCIIVLAFLSWFLIRKYRKNNYVE